ncbi:MAG: hypothetical protein H6Q13_3157 [Bacteroidetes bacterium]|nr:hypothetical protein [Bacteroidota bacterium]
MIHKELHIYTETSFEYIKRTIRNKDGEILFESYYPKTVIPTPGPIEFLEAALDGKDVFIRQDYNRQSSEIAFQLKMLNGCEANKTNLSKRAIDILRAIKNLLKELPK